VAKDALGQLIRREHVSKCFTPCRRTEPAPACDAAASNSNCKAALMVTAAPEAEVMHAASNTAEIYRSGVAQRVPDATYSSQP
jgi:hypothetical protein